MFATLVIIATWTGAGWNPGVVQAIAMPAAQCEAAKAQVPKRKGWRITAFCTSGGDPALNPRRP